MTLQVSTPLLCPPLTLIFHDTCRYVCVCVCVCTFGFTGIPFLCLVGYFSMIIWTPDVLSVLYACVLYFCICTSSAQLGMFHVEGALKIRSSLFLKRKKESFHTP